MRHRPASTWLVRWCRICPRREGDITVAYANADKAEKELNWKAETTLEEALKTTWEWQKYLKDRNN